MESEGRPAFCPRCHTEYTFYPDASAQRIDRVEVSGRLARPCFACSFREDRWDALWIPAFFVVVLSAPLLWMVWSNIIGPVVFVSPILLALWRRIRKVFGNAPPHPSDVPRGTS